MKLCFADCAVPASPGDAPSQTAEGGRGGPLALAHWVTTRDAVVVAIEGELDIATSDQAFRYVKDAIDWHRTAITVDLAGVDFCDARGLAALVRMNSYAWQQGCPLRLVSPRPHLTRIMRMTGVGSGDPSSGSTSSKLRSCDNWTI